jgi:phospholipid/cholesterol/gamma-HCH transport system substrate-binding protein
METHARHFLIGMFSLSVTAALVLFALWLGKMQLGQAYQEYDVRFRESVSGLAVGGIVQFHGIQVGEVRKLSLDPIDPREISVIVRVGADVPIKTDTKAQLSYTGLTGVAVVEIFDGSPQARLLREVDEHPVPRINAVLSNLSQLLSGGRGAMSGAQEVMNRIAELLNEANVERISKTLENVQEITQAAKVDYPKLSQILLDAQALEQRLDGALVRADALMLQLHEGVSAPNGKAGEDVFARARASLAEIESAAQAVAKFADEWKETMQKLDADARPELQETLTSLRTVSANLARITQRFDEAPVDYVLGRDRLPEYLPENKK